MTTTPTFRVADGMLVENARMEKPDLAANWSSFESRDKAINDYELHLASLRSIPIAPGCVLEGESLREGVDFIQGVRCFFDCAGLCGKCTHGKVYAVEASEDQKYRNKRLLESSEPTFSLAEALEMFADAYKAGYRSAKQGRVWPEGYGDMRTYFKQRFNIDI